MCDPIHNDIDILIFSGRGESLIELGSRQCQPLLGRCHSGRRKLSNKWKNRRTEKKTKRTKEKRQRKIEEGEEGDEAR